MRTALVVVFLGALVALVVFLWALASACAPPPSLTPAELARCESYCAELGSVVNTCRAGRLRVRAYCAHSNLRPLRFDRIAPPVAPPVPLQGGRIGD